MCGITGFFDPHGRMAGTDLNAVVRRMADTIRHRGPDDEGCWSDPQAGVALGFRRLAILDLSPTGHQPMQSEGGRFVIIFNGEIYNYASLRAELERLGYPFRGTSDTEVILAACLRWGVTETVKRLNGMFAFALWDREQHTLTLGRDRLGLKPMYYGWCGGVLLFGSELKTLLAHPLFEGRVDRAALTLYLRHVYVPAPYSIYQDIAKLPPGTLLSLPADGKPEETRPAAYWSAREAVERGTAHPFGGSAEEAVSALEARLRQSIYERMIADVPLGAFLSGGVDSSAIVALMQAQSSRPVKTFTIGFHEAGFDEAAYAREIARRLGTEHTELYVSPQEAMAVIPRLPAMYDEPFADPSQIPTHLVSQLARQHVTVSLSGDGGDEVFGGYNRYTWAQRIWERERGWSQGVRRAAAGGLRSISPRTWELLKPLLPGRARQPLFADKVRKLADILPAESALEMYRRLVSLWQDPQSAVIGGSEPPTAVSDPAALADLPGFVEQMMYLDLISYLPDDILVKVDRASMAVSLEARAPFVDDHETVEFAWSLPLEYKIRDGQSKWALRQVLYKYVPRELVERPKMGFAVPIHAWLRGPLRTWAEDLLAEDRLKNEGYFDAGVVRKKWQEHLSGRHNWQYELWAVLMFQAWLDEA